MTEFKITKASDLKAEPNHNPSKYFYADAVQKDNDQCIETLVMDGSTPPRLICLNSIVYSLKHGQYGVITFRKNKFFFENFNLLVPLSEFEGANTNNPSQTSELLVVHEENEISNFYNKLFDEYECGIRRNWI